MRRTLKVLSALLSYPTKQLKAAIPEMRVALDGEVRLEQHNRDHLDGLLEELSTSDVMDAQERYVLLFDRTRSLSLHLFEHVHGESRDRGQAMVDLMALYERHGLTLASNELPDYLPLFFEFLSQIPEGEARELLAEVSHILEAIRLRLKKRKTLYSAVFSCAQSLTHAIPQTEEVTALLREPDEDPNNLAALDAAWEAEEVKFGPSTAGAVQCGKEALGVKLRAARRPAPDAPALPPKRPIITYTTLNRA